MSEDSHSDLTISVEPMEGLARRMTVTIAANKLKNAVDAKLKTVMKKAKVNGFRPGKAPLSVIKKQYGDSARIDVINDTVYKTVSQALDQAGIEPAANPVIDNIDAKLGADLIYTVLFDVFPEIMLKDFSELSIVRENATLTDEDLNQALDRMREQHVAWESVDRVARNEDKVILDFDGYMDGEPFAGGSAEKHELVLGSGAFIPGFEDALIGVSNGDEKSIDIAFPDNYHAKELAGQPVTFKVNIHDILEKRLPELDEDFVKHFGLDDNNVEAFTNKVRDNLQRELEQRLHNNLKKALFDALFELHKELSLPKSLIERSLERKRSEFMAQFEQYAGKNRNLPPIDKELFRDEVTRDVHLGLLFTHIVENFELKADDEKVDEKIKSQAELYTNPDEFIARVKHSPREREQFTALVLEEAVVDLMLEKAKIKDKTVSYDDVMNPKQDENQNAEDAR